MEGTATFEAKLIGSWAVLSRRGPRLSRRSSRGFFCPPEPAAELAASPTEAVCTESPSVAVSGDVLAATTCWRSRRGGRSAGLAVCSWLFRNSRILAKLIGPPAVASLVEVGSDVASAAA